MKTIAEALESYPEIKKGFYGQNANIVTWFQCHISPSFLIQYYTDCKNNNMALVEQYFGWAVRANRMSLETAIVRCSIERLMMNSTRYFAMDPQGKFKDAPPYTSTAKEVSVLNNKSDIKSEILLKHFSFVDLIEMQNTGDIKTILANKYGQEFVNLLVDASGVPEMNLDTFISTLGSYETNVLKAFQALNIDQQTYLFKKYTPLQVNDAYLDGVKACCRGAFNSTSNFGSIGAAQLAWGVFDTYKEWCGNTTFTV